MKKNYTILAVVVLIAVFAVYAAPVFAADVAISPEMKNTGLMDMVNRTLPSLEPLIKQNNLQVVLSGNSLLVSDAGGQLSARFTNLLINAIAYAPKSSKITVGCSQNTGVIYIQVPNSETPFTLERTVRDVQGNTFTVKAVKGEGSVYSLKI
ncbi:MAG: hypothetical protein LWY06_13395 [Firmicutes bacterium]|nr:hypothetical protein [Bacillota bacterium]